jgi:hypothetical protein
LQEVLFHHNCICGPTVIVRRQSWEQAGFCFTEGLDASEDYDLCLRLGEVTELANLDEALYYYRQHPNSASYRRAPRQALHKAMALENALTRRFGSKPPEQRAKMVASDYLKAAIMIFATGDRNEAEYFLSHALEIYPALFKSENPLLSLIENFTPNGTTASKLEFTRSIFNDLFPHTPMLYSIKSGLLARLHMGEAFAGMAGNDWALIDRHLWLGIRNNPAWLLNRGVLSTSVKLLKKSIFRRSVG